MTQSFLPLIGLTPYDLSPILDLFEEGDRVPGVFDDISESLDVDAYYLVACSPNDEAKRVWA